MSPNTAPISCCCCICGTQTRAGLPQGVTAPVQHGKRIGAFVLYLLHYQLLPEKCLAALMADLFGVNPGIGLPPSSRSPPRSRRPIGAVIADICRDFGIMPNHPLWRELRVVVIRYGGSRANLVKDICERAVQRPTSAWPPDWTVSLQPLAPADAGPPDPGAQTAAASRTGPVAASSAFPMRPWRAVTAPAGRTARTCR